MSEIVLSRQVNEYVPSVRWIASLSNGETIFEDHLPGHEAAWKRLGEYVRENKLAITKVRVQLNELEVDLPAHQNGYIQKKRVACTGPSVSRSICIGHVDDGGAVLHQLGEDRTSITNYIQDPGHPWTIYRHDVECYRDCCTQHIANGYRFFTNEDYFGNAQEYVVKRREGENVFASRVIDGKAVRGKPKRFSINEVMHATTESKR